MSGEKCPDTAEKGLPEAGLACRPLGGCVGVYFLRDRDALVRVKAECERIARAADEYDQAGQHEYAGGLREAAHHVATLLAEIQTTVTPPGDGA